MNRAYWKVPRYARQSDPLYTSKPYDRWHAWQDIVARCNALDKPYTFMAGNIRVSLSRGQCFVTDRNLATDWGWGKSTAGDFLHWLVKDGRITLHNMGRAGTILTVRNFVRWQGDNLTTANNSTGQSPDTSIHVGPDTNPDTKPTIPPHVTRNPRTPIRTPRNVGESHSPGQSPDIIKKYKKSITAAGAVSPVVDNCGQLSPTEKAARVYEAFRLASPTNSVRPPTVRETRAIKAAVHANGGEWEPIRDMVRDSVARAVKRGDAVRSVTYGLAAWKREQEAKQKVEHGKPVPVLSGLVSGITGATASPVQRRSRKQWTGADPEGKPGDGVTKEERAAVDRALAKAREGE